MSYCVHVYYLKYSPVILRINIGKPFFFHHKINRIYHEDGNSFLIKLNTTEDPNKR